MNKSAPVLSLICSLFFANQANCQWVQTNLPEAGYYVNALATNSNNIFAATDIGGIFLSMNNGASWTAVDSGLPSSSDVTALAASGNNIFAGINSSGIFLSTNNGASWARVSTGISNDQLSTLMISGNNIFAGTSESARLIGHGYVLDPAQVFLSTNNGSAWTSVDSGLPGSMVTAFAADGNNIFVGTYGGVFLSTNNGALWTKTDSSLTGSIPLALAASHKNIFAGFWHSGVFLSTNNGSSWTAVNNGLPDSFVVRSLFVIDSNVFVGGDGGGVFLSTNNGSSWTEVNNGMPNNNDVGVKAFAVSGNNMFAGTWGSGVWRRPLSEMVPVLPQNRKSIPLQTNLRIIRELGSLVKLNYSIQSHCFVNLGIYTISGKRVAMIEQGERIPGEYADRFNCGAIPGGLYVFRFQAGGYQESNRIMLMK